MTPDLGGVGRGHKRRPPPPGERQEHPAEGQKPLRRSPACSSDSLRNRVERLMAMIGTMHT